MELYKNSIPIGNIYYMLSYAFKDLQEQNTVSINPEEFDNIHELMAEIIIRGVNYQLKKGLLRTYENVQEDLSVLRGKINISETINSGSLMHRKLVCSYDEYTEDTVMNRILKSVILLLIRSEIKKEQSVELRRIVRYFSNINEINLRDVHWDLLVYHRNQGDYRLLMSVCRIISENLLHSTDDGNVKLVSFSDENLNRLYEKFILNYYYKHYPQYMPASSEIKWAVNGEISMLPRMQSDIMLTNKATGKRLIIDAKFYTHTTQQNYGKDSFHSNNLYQIFTYVKNEAENYDGNVSGMLLYAKTTNDLIPNDGVSFDMNGNSISIGSLDLSGRFCDIAKQLDINIDRIR